MAGSSEMEMPLDARIDLVYFPCRTATGDRTLPPGDAPATPARSPERRDGQTFMQPQGCELTRTDATSSTVRTHTRREIMAKKVVLLVGTKKGLFVAESSA